MAFSSGWVGLEIQCPAYPDWRMRASVARRSSGHVWRVQTTFGRAESQDAVG
jgi:hypothetical protein